jgi:hypothetical protein
MTIGLKKVGALLSSFLLILSCQSTTISTVPKEIPKTQILNNKLFSKKSVDCYIGYIPRSGATIVSHSGGLIKDSAYVGLSNGKLSYDALYTSYGPDAIPLNVEFNVGNLKDGDTVSVSGLGRQIYAFYSIGQAFGGKLWEIPLSGTVTLKDGRLNLKFSGNVANCTTGRAELAICGQNGSQQEPLGGSIEAEIPYNGCLSLDVSRDLVSFHPDNDSEFNNVTLDVNASNFVNSRLVANNYTFIKDGKGNYSENLNKDNTHGIPDGNNVIMVSGGYYQSDTKSLKVDSTPPEVVDINIDDSSEPIKIKVKVKDPEVNGFSSGIDKDETKIESSLGGTSICDGETITYTYSSSTNIEQLSQNSNNGNFSIYVADKARNKYKTKIKPFDAFSNISNEPKFNTKAGIGTGRSDTSNAKVCFSDGKQYYLKSILVPRSNGVIPAKELRGGHITFRVTRIYDQRNFAKLDNKPIYNPNFYVFEKKIFFNNNPPEIQQYGISSNLLTVPWDLTSNNKQDIGYKGKYLGNNGTFYLPSTEKPSITQKSGEHLISGLYVIEVTNGLLIYNKGDLDNQKMFPLNKDFSKHKFVFKLINGQSGNGKYMDLDLDPTLVPKRGIVQGQKAAFEPQQLRKIHEINHNSNIFLINQRLKSFGYNPSDLKPEQYDRLIIDDVSGQLLKTPLSYSPLGEKLPDILENKIEEGQVDHIIPKGAKVECCPNKGNNSYSNAQVIAGSVNCLGAKGNQCDYCDNGFLY